MPPDDRIVWGVVVDEICHKQSDFPERKVFHKGRDEITPIVFHLQKIEFGEDEHKHVQFRFGYYIKGVKKGGLGRWLWGQYAPLIPSADFKVLVQEAQKKRWF